MTPEGDTLGSILAEQTAKCGRVSS